MKSVPDDAKSSVKKQADEKSAPAVVPSFAEERFQRMISEVEDYAIFFLSKEGIISSWNRGAQKIKGYTAEEVIGKHFKIFYPKEDRERGLPDTLLQEAVEHGKANHEGWRIRKDGSRFWGTITITSVHDSNGKLSGFVKVTRDVTDKKIVEDKLSNYLEELKEKNEQLRLSEERYHKMIMQVQDYSIILLSREGRILDWNKGAEKLKGYHADEIIGKSFKLFYSREDKEAKLPEKLLNEAVQHGRVYHEGWRLRKDGSRFWGSVSITALHSDMGEIIGFSKVTRDLTERKIAEEKLNAYADELKDKVENLRQSEERYYRMIDEVQDYAIILLTVDGYIQNWNAGAQFIKGYMANEIIGKHFSIFYTKEDRERRLPDQIIEEALTNGRAIHEGWRVRKDGSRFWGNVVMTTLHNHAGEVIGFSKVTRDLTEKKNAEETLKANAAQLDLKNKALERLNSELSSFAYIASHDMKEPLRKIQTFASRLDEIEDLSEKGREYLHRIHGSSARMQLLIEDLLVYAQVGNEVSTLIPVDLNNILKSVKNDLEVPIHEKHATIESTELPVINGIQFQLHQLFMNLFSNSLKFAKQDTPPVIRIDSRITEGPKLPGGVFNGNYRYHQISITDNGIGFEKEFSTKIFDPFQRLHPTKTFQGSGLGLAIVKKIVDNHNGIIVAEGEPGVGAAFNIYLPVAEKEKYAGRHR